ncbi:MAG: DMT family transporter [Burkholderiaceae bacterium]|nr:DMT family transporter [Burkholderiaceae bacterium]
MASLRALSELPARRAKGMALGLVAAASFTLLHASVRYASRELHVFEITFFRYFFALFFMLPALLRSRGAVLTTERLHLHLIRCVMLMISMLGIFSALTMTPIATVTALSFISPVFASAAAIVLLRERSTPTRWLAVAAGVAGMLLIVRPGLVPLSAGPVLAVCGALAWAVSIIVIKLMSTTESSTTQVAYMSVIVTPLTFLLAVWVWKWPSLQMIPVLVFTALIATVGQFAYTKAFQYAEATALMPLDFTRLMWASLVGFLVFGEVPDIWSWIGGTVIFMSAAYITLHEARAGAAKGRQTP